MSGLASATQSYVQIEGMNIFLDIEYPHQMWYDLDCTNVRKKFIGGEFIPKKETRLGFANSNFVDRN